MKGLLVWAHSYCRSTLAFYEGLAAAFGVPLKILFWIKGTSNRTAVGYSDEEFKHLDTRFIENDFQNALMELEQHKGWHHLFGTYQKGTVFREMLLRAKEAGDQVAIASESPCNMVRPPGSMLKACYISTILRKRVSRQVQAAEFIINLSGDHADNLKRIGWPSAKIINCGYFSPPLVGSAFRTRDQSHWRKFSLLMTGSLEWHRNPMVLLRALKRLRQRGVYCKAIVTQSGPMLKPMMVYAVRHHLDVEFVGFVPYDKLIELYQTCSCFAATGRAEPWGIRVNDALHCGAPLVVSEGMGAVKLVKDFGCGIPFSNNDSDVLANTLQYLISDEAMYLQFAHHVEDASVACLPHRQASRIASEISMRFPKWM